MSSDEDCVIVNNKNIDNIIDKYLKFTSKEQKRSFDLSSDSDSESDRKRVVPQKVLKVDSNKFNANDTVNLSSSDDSEAEKQNTLDHWNDNQPTSSKYIFPNKSVEISSSDEDQISNKPSNKGDIQKDDEAERPKARTKTKYISHTKSFEISSSDEDEISSKPSSNIQKDDEAERPKSTTKTKYIARTKSVEISASDEEEISNKPSNNIQKDDEAERPKVKPVRRKNINTKTKEEQANAKAQREKAKLERAKHKEEADKEKQMRKTIQSAHKNMRDDCVKFMITQIDNEIFSNSFGDDILKELEELGSTYQQLSQPVECSITWIRKVESFVFNDENELVKKVDEKEEMQVLVIINWDNCAKYISENKFLEYLGNLQPIYPDKRISLAIFGMENYFRYFKNQTNKEQRNELLPSKKTSSTDKTFKDAPRVTREQLEFDLTKAQLLYNICAKFVETSSDLAKMIIRFTKSIAQAPYKEEKQEKHIQSEWYMSGDDSKDTARVDKDGNGLKRLWQQFIISMPLRSCPKYETAEAIMGNFPTLKSLMIAFENCQTEMQKYFLLQNLQVRRNAGVVNNSKKLGLEASRKISTYYTTFDGDTIL